MRDNAPPLTPLQEKLRANAMLRVEKERQAMLAPVFAALERWGAYFTYEANPVLIRHFWDSIVHLHPKAYSNPSTHQPAFEQINSMDRETVQTALDALTRDHGLEGPVHIHFQRQIHSQSTHLEFIDHWFGFITCDLGGAVSLVADICDARLDILTWEGLVITGIGRRWAIWLESGELTLTAVR